MRLVIVSWCVLSLPAVAVPCTDLPVLFVVQDKSGSMNFAPDGTAPTAANPSKWSVAQTVVPALATQFANRFRFGAELFPGATSTFNCTTGTVVAGVSGSPVGVQSAYLDAQAGGGTPTASSLSLARSHLQSLGLTTPAYVLLITDGLPNCNLSLNPGTCTATTPGCGNNSCGLGAKDCLDDNDTVAAARALYSAGIKVFVVGFDASLTAGNNKAVLDAVAAAGGTSHASVASNQAQLSSTLNQIALNTATCCHDACAAGAAQCTASGQRQTCALDPAIGCTTWTTASCPTMSTCSNGQCQSCQNQCTAGALRCNASGNAEQCVTGASGCTEWSAAEVCVYGELCTGGHCGSCQACSIGASRCTAAGVERCAWDVLSGCTTWKASACAPGSTCRDGSCEACNSTCTAGATRCNGNGVETCAADASGCTAWNPTQTCATFCSGGACGTCGTSCAAGATRCDGAGVETCIIDANNCSAWGPTQRCAPNSVCASGVCAECSTTCAQGTKRCGVNGATEECRLSSTGCTDFVATGQCDLAAGERCEQGACVTPCHDTCAAGAGQCSAVGVPQACARAPSGCLAWKEQPACGADSVCSSGACLTRCTGGELEGCPLGMTCVGVAEGRVCVPVAADAGVPDAGAPGAADAGESVITSIGAHPGCGCSSLDGAVAPLLVMAAWWRRRREVGASRYGSRPSRT